MIRGSLNPTSPTAAICYATIGHVSLTMRRSPNPRLRVGLRLVRRRTEHLRLLVTAVW
jgi:hypothetical protein